jgi:hypothetical protein
MHAASVAAYAAGRVPPPLAAGRCAGFCGGRWWDTGVWGGEKVHRPPVPVDCASQVEGSSSLGRPEADFHSGQP